MQKLITEIEKKVDMEKVIGMLSMLQYRFVSSEFIETLNSKLEWKKKSHKRYQWMVRLDHIDPDPTKDIYNTDMMVGIRFFDTRAPFILIYKEGRMLDTIKMPWSINETKNHKKKKVPLTFPDIMSIQDRINWRKYHIRWNKGLLQSQEELIYYFNMKPHIGNLDKEDLHLS